MKILQKYKKSLIRLDNLREEAVMINVDLENSVEIHKSKLRIKHLLHNRYYNNQMSEEEFDKEIEHIDRSLKNLKADIRDNLAKIKKNKNGQRALLNYLSKLGTLVR